jgi:hypothetical protein
MEAKLNRRSFMGSTMIRISAITLCAAAFVLGGLHAAKGEYLIVGTQNPAYRANTVFSAPEDLTSPRFAGLVDRYKLNDVVKGETDEFRRILLLRNWLNRHLVIDQKRPAAEGDALKILEEGPKGGRYSCGHFEAAQNAVMNAMGYVTRCVLSGPDGEDPQLTGHHGSNEVWCNSLCKWVMIDAELDSHFEKDGVPLSALEIRDAYLADGAAGVARVQGFARKPVPRGKYDQWGYTPKAYAFIGWRQETDRFTIWPRDGSSVEVVYDDEYFQTHTWYMNGRKHWAYDSGYFLRVKDRGAIYWTPNVLEVKARIEGTAALVEIDSSTPNLKDYQMRGEGGGWERVEKSFRLSLSKPREEWRLRSVNLAGVAGPEYRLVIERK